MKKKLKDFFVYIEPNLDTKTQHEFFNTTDNSQDPIQNAICKYENHPSIILILRNMWNWQILLLFLKPSQKRKLRN